MLALVDPISLVITSKVFGKRIGDNGVQVEWASISMSWFSQFLKNYAIFGRTWSLFYCYTRLVDSSHRSFRWTIWTSHSNPLKSYIQKKTSRLQDSGFHPLVLKYSLDHLPDLLHALVPWPATSSAGIQLCKLVFTCGLHIITIIFDWKLTQRMRQLETYSLMMVGKFDLNCCMWHANRNEPTRINKSRAPLWNFEKLGHFFLR